MINFTREQWIQYGVRQGFCSAPFCNTHEGPPLADTEYEIFDEGNDPCVFAIRIGTQAEWEEEAESYKEIL